MSKYGATLEMPKTMPADFAQYLRDRAEGQAVTGIIRAKLDVTPAKLWSIADDATRGSDVRAWAFFDLWQIIVSANGLLPDRTVSEKAEAQRAVAESLAVTRSKCRNDAFTESADLKELLALSAAHQTEDDEYVAQIAAVLHKLGGGNTGIKLPKLLAGLSKALHSSADNIDSLRQTGRRVNRDRTEVKLSDRAARKYEMKMASAQGHEMKGRITDRDGGFQFVQETLPLGVRLNLSTMHTSFNPTRIKYEPLLYGPFEPVHDADFPKTPPEAGQNHSWVATGLLRWMRTHAGVPHKPVVRETVESLCGPKDDDFMTNADRRAKRS